MKVTSCYNNRISRPGRYAGLGTGSLCVLKSRQGKRVARDRQLYIYHSLLPPALSRAAAKSCILSKKPSAEKSLPQMMLRIN